jgi:hypothetical protein
MIGAAFDVLATLFFFRPQRNALRPREKLFPQAF